MAAMQQPPFPGGPTLQLARRRRGGAKDEATRQAQAQRRWTSIPPTSPPWLEWEAATKKVIESGRGDAIKFVVPPRAEASDQTYVLFALDGPFQLTSFSKDGRRFAIFERIPQDRMLADTPASASAAREYEPDPQKAAAQDLADAARDLAKIRAEIASGLRDKEGRPVAQGPGGNSGVGEAQPSADGSAPSEAGKMPETGGLPETSTQPNLGAAAPADVSGEGGHSTVVGAGGGLLLAANMTLLLTERPGASLVVGPCYANVQEGSQAMQNGSYAIGLSEIYAIDFEAARRLEAQEQEAAAIEAAFLEELEKEEGKKGKGKKKKGSRKKKKAAPARPEPQPVEEDPIAEEEEEEQDAGPEVTRRTRTRSRTRHLPAGTAPGGGGRGVPCLQFVDKYSHHGVPTIPCRAGGAGRSDAGG